MTADLLHRYQFADTELVSSAAIAELMPAREGDSRDRLTVHWQRQGSSAVPAWYHEWLDGEELWARFGAVPSGYVVDFPAHAEFRISAAGDEVNVWLRPGVPDVTGRHLLLNQVVPLMLSRRGRLVLHAGAVAVNGAITAFVGPTGSGKSTLVAATAERGAAVVADDSLVLYRAGHGWTGVPSYPAVRLWATSLERFGWGGVAAAHYTEKHRVAPDHGGWRFAPGPAPLVRLLLLDGDVPRRPVAVELYSQIFRLDVRDLVEARRLFHAVADLASGLAIERLGSVHTRSASDVAARLTAPPRGVTDDSV